MALAALYVEGEATVPKVTQVLGNSSCIKNYFPSLGSDGPQGQQRRGTGLSPSPDPPKIKKEKGALKFEFTRRNNSILDLASIELCGCYEVPRSTPTSRILPAVSWTARHF